jgi:F-box domain.
MKDGTSGVHDQSCRSRFRRPHNVGTSSPVGIALSNICQLLKVEPLSTGTLLCLPVEVLVEIFNWCDYLDRMCFAMVCRRLLQVSSLVRIRIPSVIKHQFLPPSTCPHIFLLLRRIEPRDDQGQRDRTLGLCCDCLRRRTRRKSFWGKYEDEYSTKLEKILNYWQNAVRHWHDGYSFQCPECWCREKLCLYQ